MVINLTADSVRLPPPTPPTPRQIRTGRRKIGARQKVRFFSSTKEHGIRKPWRLQGAQRETPLPWLAEPSREARRVAIGRGRINPTIKLRLPRGKARQIAWMSTVPGNHDQIALPRISGGTDACQRKKSLAFILPRTFFSSQSSAPAMNSTISTSHLAGMRMIIAVYVACKIAEILKLANAIYLVRFC